MGWIIFILIIAVIIGVVISKKKNNNENAIEDLKNCKAYELAIKIQDELSNNGISINSDNFNEPLVYNNVAVGTIHFASFSGAIRCCADHSSNSPLWRYTEGDIKIKNARAGRRCFYAVKNDNIGILVESRKETQEIPPFIEIAMEVIRNNGYGSCTFID